MVGAIPAILSAVNILNLLYSCRDPPAGAGSVEGRMGEMEGWGEGGREGRRE